VNDAVNVWVRSKHLVKASFVGNIDLNKLWLLPADQFNAIQNLCGGIVQAVGNDDFVASFQKGQGREGPNITRSSIPTVSMLFCD
jgi:hypothetical protein